MTAINTTAMDHSDVIYWRSYATQTAKGIGLRGDDLEDAVQAALIALYEAWDKADERDPKPYYSRIVSNGVRMYARSKRAYDCIDVESLIADDCYEAIDRAIDAKREVEALTPLLATLTSYQRDVINGYASGDSTTEIAGELGRTFCAVESARRNIRRKVRGHFPSPS